LPIPANWHADMAEFAGVLRAVDLTRDRFTMIELGCGWGCWMVNSGVAAKRRGRRIRLIGVEGDEGHIGFAKETLATNHISPVSYTLRHGVAGAVSGVALFPRQDQSGEHWGLEPKFDPTPDQRNYAIATGDYRELPVIALDDIIGNESRISLLHMDIQGGEAGLIRDCIQTLTSKVMYLVIGTHSREIEGILMGLLRSAGWTLEIERPSIFALTSTGPVTTVDGVQAWLNTRLATSL
jgi:FkbM family methyltransferase